MLEGEEEDYLLGRSQCATEITQAKVQSRSIWDARCALHLPVVSALAEFKQPAKFIHGRVGTLTGLFRALFLAWKHLVRQSSSRATSKMLTAPCDVGKRGRLAIV